MTPRPVPYGTQTHVRPRMGPVPGWVEYDGPAGARVRKAVPDITASAARRFHVRMGEAGKNPSLIKKS